MSSFVWHPPRELFQTANVAALMRRLGCGDVQELVERSVRDPDEHWGLLPEELGIVFDRPWERLRDSSRGVPWTEWYVGGRLNLVTSCLERHAEGDLGERTCLIAEREDGEVTTLTFRKLAQQVERCAAALAAAGVGAGDRVGALMPMSHEVVVQMLATIKIGAIFIPIFSGYAAPAVAERLRHAEAKLLFTADVSFRRGQEVAIEATAEQVAAAVPTVERIVVVRRARAWRGGKGVDPAHSAGRRKVDWEAFLEAGGEAVATASLESMAPALILYTSGTSGNPKGTVHSHAGTLVQVAKEVGYAFDVKPEDRFFWLTDIGWMMGPWMILGGLFHGATVVLYEGAFDYPGAERLWQLLERHRVTIFGISPTAIRLQMQTGRVPGQDHDLSGLRLLGSTGEPWDDRSWMWYFEQVGGSRCPVINISGGTDIIGCFLSPLPLHPLKPRTLVGPGLGMAVDVWSEEGRPVRGEVGYLVATHPAPSMTRGLWREPERYLESYWSRWPDVWDHGDWARIDEDGYWFVEGRADDTLKVAGRRIGPAEVEGALIATGKIAEAAAVGVPHEVKGEGIVCFAVPAPGVEPSEALREELSHAVVSRLGKIDRPEKVLFVADLPKTRSAKILRRLVRARHLGREDLGDLSSLQNPEALEAIDRAL